MLEIKKWLPLIMLRLFADSFREFITFFQKFNRVTHSSRSGSNQLEVPFSQYCTQCIILRFWETKFYRKFVALPMKTASNVYALGGVIIEDIQKINLTYFIFCFFTILVFAVTGCSSESTLYLSPGYAQPASQTLPSIPPVQQQTLASTKGQFAIESPEVRSKLVAIADQKAKEYIIGTWNSNHSNFSYAVTKVNGNVIQSTNTTVTASRKTFTFNADKTLFFRTEVRQPAADISQASELRGNWEIKNGQLYIKINAQSNQGSYLLIADIIWLNQDSFVMKYDPASYTKMLKDASAQTTYPAGVSCSNQYRYYHAASGFSYCIMQMQAIQPNGHIADTTVISKTERMLYAKAQPQTAVLPGTPVTPMFTAANNIASPGNQFAQQPIKQNIAQPQIPHNNPPRKKPEGIARPFYALGRIAFSPLNIIGLTSTECQKINSDMAFMYAFVPVITIPAGVLAMSGDIIVGCLELLTFQAFEVRYPWESFKPSKSQGEIIKFTTSLLSIATVAAAYGAANYASTYSAVKAANANTPPPTSYSNSSPSRGASSSIITHKEERRECSVCHTKHWGVSCPSCKYRINFN